MPDMSVIVTRNTPFVQAPASPAARVLDTSLDDETDTPGVAAADARLQSPAPEPIVDVEHVSFAYRDEPVLEDVTLTVRRGMFLGLVGPNGSGKTTLLRLILGLERPQAGRVRLFGEEVHRFRQWHRVGYVPQRVGAHLRGFPATVAEVVLTGRTARRGLLRRLGPEDRAKAYQALALVGLESLAGRPIGQLSGGQQQRVFIARALAGEPELLILDEPTVGVDAGSQAQFYAMLRQLRQELGLTVILVSHDIGAITEEVSHLACLHRRLFFHGPPDQFRGFDALYGHPVTLVRHGH